MDATTKKWDVLVGLKDSHLPDVMAAHPIALRLRSLQALAEIAIEHNSTIVSPGQLTNTARALDAFVRRETDGARTVTSLGAG